MQHPATQEEGMTYKEVLKTYKKMGLGTQEERDRFLQWSTDTDNENGHHIFFIESPNTKTNQEESNAQLARNPK